MQYYTLMYILHNNTYISIHKYLLLYDNDDDDINILITHNA